MALANSSYEGLRLSGDNDTEINLALTVDEREFLDVDLVALLTDEVRKEADQRLPYLDNYFLQDPYGDRELGSAVADHFGRPGWPCDVSCSSGVTSLLHALSRLAPSGPVLLVGDVYPDLPHWVRRSGGRCLTGEDPLREVRESGAVLTLVDRPSPLGNGFDDLETVRELCTAAGRHGGFVAVDESYANYYPALYSAATIAQDLDNLFVLRGLSKAYWLGGLRMGYCVSSPRATDHLRETLPPMQASSLSMRIAREVVSLGDVTTRLRARIRYAKRRTLNLLAGAGFPAPITDAGLLPHLMFDEDFAADGWSTSLEARGILGKEQPLWSQSRGRTVRRYRLSVPLREDRIALFERLLLDGVRGG